MKKRIFVAIKVSTDIKKKIKSVKKDYEDLPLKWHKDSDLHITILPPWDEENIGEVREKLKEIKDKMESFEIGFNHITLGPYYDRPKLVWAKGKATKEIYTLREKLESVFQKYSQRRFKLHLTLARFSREDTRSIMNAWQNKNISWTQKVDSIVLFESILDDDGVKYEVLDELKI